jgi:hypothetical protein
VAPGRYVVHLYHRLGVGKDEKNEREDLRTLLHDERTWQGNGIGTLHGYGIVKNPQRVYRCGERTRQRVHLPVLPSRVG